MKQGEQNECDSLRCTSCPIDHVTARGRHPLRLRAFYKLRQPTVAATADVAAPIGRVYVAIATADTAPGVRVSHFLCGVMSKQLLPFIAAGGSLGSGMFDLL